MRANEPYTPLEQKNQKQMTESENSACPPFGVNAHQEGASVPIWYIPTKFENWSGSGADRLFFMNAVSPVNFCNGLRIMHFIRSTHASFSD